MEINLPEKSANKLFNNMAVQEAELVEVPGAICPHDDSRVRFGSI